MPRKCALSSFVAILGGPESEATAPFGVKELIARLCAVVPLPQRETTGPLVFSVDHCFAIKGQGTVLTGTVLGGCVQIGDNVEVPDQQLVKKVKAIQMFRKPVSRAVQGDRVGICVTQFDPKAIERALVCTPGSMPSITGLVIIIVKKNEKKLKED